MACILLLALNKDFDVFNEAVGTMVDCWVLRESTVYRIPQNATKRLSANSHKKQYATDYVHAVPGPGIQLSGALLRQGMGD